MKPWPNIGRVDVGLDFGEGAAKIGGGASAERRVFFQYDRAFIERGINPSPFRLKPDAEVQSGVAGLDGLPGLLHDSLPDGWSRLVLDRYIRTQGYDPTSLGILHRLALVGTQGAGALTYHSRVAMPLEPLAIDFDTAAALATKAVEESDADRIQAAPSSWTHKAFGAAPRHST